MKKKFKGPGPLIAGMTILFALLIGPHQVQAAALWEFKVPIILKNMPQEMKYICVHWYLYGENLAVDLMNKQEFVPVNLDSRGDFFINVTIKIDDTDLPDPAKAKMCLFNLKLSEDGSTAYAPNASGYSWTKSKSGAKLVKQVIVVKLDETPENHPWKA